MSVLVVEDNPNDVLLIRRAFQKLKLDLHINVVQNGEEAMAYLAGNGPYSDRQRFPFPALVLLDLKLPRRSGFDVLAWVRQQPTLKRLLIVVLTSSREQTDIDRAFETGANSYVVKVADPRNMADLVNTLHSYWMTINQRPSLAH
jgi:CheY-like chemotaxis protein